MHAVCQTNIQSPSCGHAPTAKHNLHQLELTKDALELQVSDIIGRYKVAITFVGKPTKGLVVHVKLSCYWTHMQQRISINQKSSRRRIYIMLSKSRVEHGLERILVERSVQFV